VRLDSTGSYLSNSIINTPVGTQDLVPVALRQAADKVTYQDYRRAKEFKPMKVPRLALYRRVRVATSKFSTRAGFCSKNKTVRIGDTFPEWESAAGKVACHET
jgi:hypothetical protein